MQMRATELESGALGAEEYRTLERSLRRLHEAMRGFWGAWPVGRRTPTVIARETGVDRTTCQRVSALVRTGFDFGAMIEGMPGPRALRTLIEAAERVGAPPAENQRAQLRSAADHFEEVLRAQAGSMAKLKRRLAEPAGPDLGAASGFVSGFVSGVASGNAGQPVAARGEGVDGAQEALFHAAHQITRRRALANVSIGLYDTVGVGEGELRHVRVSGNYGMVAESDAVPMVLEAFDGDGGRDGDGWQRTPCLISSMTSAAWKRVPLDRSPGFSAHAMEIVRSTTPSDVYIWTVFPVPHPRTLDRPVEESWYVLYSPAAALVFDMYVHESVARSCLMSLDVHLWQTSFANAPHGKWQTRLPDAPPMLQLGRGPARVEPAAHPRHTELTRAFFEIADADPSEYVLYRCEQRFPVWRAGYRFELDFGSP